MAIFVAKPQSFFVCAVFAVVAYRHAAAFAEHNANACNDIFVAAFLTYKTRAAVADGYNFSAVVCVTSAARNILEFIFRSDERRGGDECV